MGVGGGCRRPHRGLAAQLSGAQSADSPQLSARRSTPAAQVARPCWGGPGPWLSQVWSRVGPFPCNMGLLSPLPLSGGHRAPTDCGSGLFLPFLLMLFCPPDSSAASAESGGQEAGRLLQGSLREDGGVLAQAAVTTHRLGGLNNRTLLLMVLRLEVQDQGASLVGFLVKSVFLVYVGLSS